MTSNFVRWVDDISTTQMKSWLETGGWDFPDGWHCQDCSAFYEKKPEKCTKQLKKLNYPKILKFHSIEDPDENDDPLYGELNDILAKNDLVRMESFYDKYIYSDYLGHEDKDYIIYSCNSTDLVFEKAHHVRGPIDLNEIGQE